MVNYTMESVTEAVLEDTGRSPQADIIVGVLMMIFSFVCGLAYSVILYTIWHDKDLIKMPSYQIMFTLGLFDVLQCFPHFVTGIFTIYQTTFSYGLAKAMGVLATPGYVGYAVLTIILSFNRFIQMLSHEWDERLFTGRSVKVWIGIGLFIWLLFAIALASPYAAIVYIPEWYSWAYDESPYSWLVQTIEMYIEVGGIFISAIFYAFVIILLAKKRKKFMTNSKQSAEMKILIQASVITVYCTVLNVFWHKYDVLLPANIWSYSALNFMWIGNSGVYPLIYFIVNRALRQRIRIHKHKPTVTGATMLTRIPSKAPVSESSQPKVMQKAFGESEKGKEIRNNVKIQMKT